MKLFRVAPGIYSLKTFCNWANPGLLRFIFVISNTNFTKKIVDVGGILTWIVGVKGKHADHLTTTTALP